jgi:hypothetical protein
MPKVDSSGALFHAKHAFMPNKLGYCGPDDRGMILERLRESSVDDRLVSTLENFEAAYPFIRLIGKSNQRDPFDRKVTDAYWIGNKLLGKVSPKAFYNFALEDLRKKNGEEIRSLFRTLRDKAIPHHTFYVISTTMSIISDFHHTSAANPNKLSETMDNCRISWGRVNKIERDRLKVLYRPLRIEDGVLSLGPMRTKAIEYDRSVSPFNKITGGDYVSIHWNFACEILSETQLRNIQIYTEKDIQAANIFLEAAKRSK